MNNWKDMFTSLILHRGLEYSENREVGKIIKTELGFSATVHGGSDYKVELTIKNGVLTHQSCTCPYAADGENCKHMAAVLFEIESNLPEYVPKIAE